MKIKHIFIIGILLVLFTSCTSTPSKTTQKEEDFHYYTLANGIPLVVKSSTANNVSSLQLIIKGGVSLLPKEKSGLEAATLAMLFRGSEKYSFEDIQHVCYETQSSINYGANQLGSILSVNALNYYIDDLLPVFFDCFLHPTFEQVQFERYMTEVGQNLQQMQENPSYLLQYLAEQVAYEGHMYQTTAGFTFQSYNNITLDTIKEWHPTLLQGGRIEIVAVGNFDEPKLVETLNSYLQDLPVAPQEKVAVPSIQIKGKAPIIQPLEAAQGTGYVAGLLPAPDFASEDEIVAELATSIYNELLFNIVREKYGACYSIGSAAITSKAPFIAIYVYMVSNPQNFVSYIKEATELMAKGTIISNKNSVTGEYEYTTIEERLEGYKNAFINASFSSSQTNIGIGNKLVSSILMYDDPENYLSFTEKVQKVTAADIQRVFNTYWDMNNIQWVAISGIGEEENFAF